VIEAEIRVFQQYLRIPVANGVVCERLLSANIVEKLVNRGTNKISHPRE
jgi:hypothetical protein